MLKERRRGRRSFFDGSTISLGKSSHQDSGGEMKRLFSLFGGILLAGALLVVAPTAILSQYNKGGRAHKYREQQRDLGTTAQVLMKSPREKQAQAVRLIKQTTEELKKIEDPYDIQGAVLELQMAMGPHHGYLGGQPSEQKLELIATLLSKLESLLDPEEVNRMKAQAMEGSNKGNLGAIRSALSIFYGDKEGYYPSDPNEELISKYLARIPKLELEHHKPSDRIRLIRHFDGDSIESAVEDSGQWAYIADPSSKHFGSIFIDCSHVDSRGRVWHRY